MLIQRPRILRQSPAIRAIVQETNLSPNNLLVPLFIVEGEGIAEEITSLPGYFRYSLDETVKEVEKLWRMGIKAVLLFIKCKDELKDNAGTEALNPYGLMQRSIKAIKNACPGMLVMTDVALDPFSSFGHDGIVHKEEIMNDETVTVLAKMALSHAQAGADFVAPSDMMDGRIGAIRLAFEQA
ncbi:MAG: porphobilinogen synthase, partial [Chitinophagaceae bacterium]